MKTIKVTQEVHDMLSEIGSKKDTYNDIIFKLINEHNYKIIEHELNLAKEQSVTRRNNVFLNDVIVQNVLSLRFNVEINLIYSYHKSFVLLHLL